MVKETKTTEAWRWCCQRPTFTRRELVEANNISNSYADKMLARWIKSHSVEICTTKQPRLFSAIPSNPPPFGKGSNSRLRGPCERKRNYRKTGRQKIWNSIKISRRFTLADLIATCGVNRTVAWCYVEGLVRAGYVKTLHRREHHLPLSDRTPSRYQLLRDTGRYAPMLRKDGVWDQNEQRLYIYELPPVRARGGEYENVA